MDRLLALAAFTALTTHSMHGDEPKPPAEQLQGVIKIQPELFSR